MIIAACVLVLIGIAGAVGINIAKREVNSVKHLLASVNEASSEIVRPAIQVLSDYPMSGLKSVNHCFQRKLKYLILLHFLTVFRYP